AAVRCAAVQQSQQRRTLSIHEHLSMGLLREYGVPVPAGQVATSPVEAEAAAAAMKTEDTVLKAQVLAGGRGKGHFTGSNLQGGVKILGSPEEVGIYAAKMLGNKLVTKQTGVAGRICNAVYVAERKYVRKEYYFAIIMDRASGGPCIIASSQGGMDIETVAKESPEAIVTHPISLETGLTTKEAQSVATKLGFVGEAVDQAADTFQKLYKIFQERDATMIEINPLAEIAQGGGVMCMDAKFSFDDNAEFRQKEVFKLRDFTQEDSREVAASKWGLNYIGLDGNIGCLVNGAGLAM
ncbi:hypothetical protein CXG81DRAFT_3808, partial [Caulochytrium protostelioides]